MIAWTRPEWSSATLLERRLVVTLREQSTRAFTYPHSKLETLSRGHRGRFIVHRGIDVCPRPEPCMHTARLVQLSLLEPFSLPSTDGAHCHGMHAAQRLHLVLADTNP
jgi:hypothetical protein